MRKYVLSAACLLFMSGLALATNVTLVKYNKDSKEVTVKEGDEQKTYKITDKTKFFAVAPDGTSKELTYDDALKGLSNAKAEGKLMFDVTVKDGEVIEAKLKARKK